MGAKGVLVWLDLEEDARVALNFCKELQKIRHMEVSEVYANRVLWELRILMIHGQSGHTMKRTSLNGRLARLYLRGGRGGRELGSCKKSCMEDEWIFICERFLSP